MKSEKYKGDLAQIVVVAEGQKRATIKLVPRIDLPRLVQNIILSFFLFPHYFICYQESGERKRVRAREKCTSAERASVRKMYKCH